MRRVFLSLFLVLGAVALGSAQTAAPKPAAPKPAAPPNRLLNPAALTAKAPELFKVKFDTSKGVVMLELHRDWAPLGVDRFYNMTRNGFFSGARFFRVMPNFMAQFGINGDPAVNAAWKEKYVRDDPPRSMNRRGTFAFAFKAMPNTRNTQIYINLGDNSRNDAEAFTVLGTVIEGMAVIDSL